MLNNPWDNGSPRYRLSVILGLVFTGVGILFSLIGITTESTVLTWIALPCLGIGLLAYALSMIFRLPARKK